MADPNTRSMPVIKEEYNKVNRARKDMTINKAGGGNPAYASILFAQHVAYATNGMQQTGFPVSLQLLP